MAKQRAKRPRTESPASGARKQRTNSPEIRENEEEEQDEQQDEPVQTILNPFAELPYSFAIGGTSLLSASYVLVLEDLLKNINVTWEYKRYHLIHHKRKTMFTGYEAMIRDINMVLGTLEQKSRKEVKKSCLGRYTRLNDYNTKNGLMIHYVVFREVTPSPNPDTTTLWFKGLHFGKSYFDPYKPPRLRENSIFERLFRCNDKTTTADVSRMFKDKKFTYFEGDGDNKKEIEVNASEENYVKLSKLLMATTYALRFETARKAIPLWMWVLLEDNDAWEKFPWGSDSYQSLINSITNVKKEKVPKSGTVSYHIIGNIIAFSAWIFEAIPIFGDKIGSRKPKRSTPHFLRYTYVESRLPTEDKINQ
ncbi:hypothetical protein OROHE_006093 [Orobanche hederae]